MASRDARKEPSPQADAPAASAAMGPGRVLGGRYRLEAPLGRGGMGTVWRATQLSLGRSVAVKVLHADYRGRRPRDFHRRFAVEARAAARLAHPHSITVLDYGCEPDGTYYLVMERLRGRTLAELLLEHGPMAPARAVAIALQIGRAVQAAHATGVVHRDLKPANVMVLDWGEDAANGGEDFVKVLDFGLAKQFGAATESITRTGQFLGSPGYMAPEQITGAELDGRCDVYALGAVLFQMLAGRPPYLGSSPHEVMRSHLHADLPPLWPQGRDGLTQKLLARDVPPDGPQVEGPGGVALGRQRAALEVAVRRAMAKRPDQRFASMGKLLEALHAAALLAPAATAPSAEGGPEVAPSSVRAHNAWPTVARWLPAEAGAEVTALVGEVLASVRAPVRVRAPAAGLGAPLALRSAGTLAALPDGHQQRGGRRPARSGRHQGWRRRLRNAAPAWLAAALGLALGQPPLSASPPASAITPPSARASTVRLRLDSTPPGAQVFADGQQVCRATPCVVAWPSPTAVRQATGPAAKSATARVRLRFSLAAHDDTLVQRRLPVAVADADGQELSVSALLR